jgi:hypothetical protein
LTSGTIASSSWRSPSSASCFSTFLARFVPPAISLENRFACWRRPSNHERNGGKYLKVVRGHRCGLQEADRAFFTTKASYIGYCGGIRAESGAEEPRPVSATTEGGVETASTTATFTISVAADDAKIGQDAQVNRVAAIPPDEREIQRRRELVRALFNEFWSGRDDKPAAFVDRLDQAEACLNEQLTACGEFWQLDANTRKTLSLPLRSNSRSKGKAAQLTVHPNPP